MVADHLITDKKERKALYAVPHKVRPLCGTVSPASQHYLVDILWASDWLRQQRSLCSLDRILNNLLFVQIAVRLRPGKLEHLPDRNSKRLNICFLREISVETLRGHPANWQYSASLNRVVVRFIEVPAHAKIDNLDGEMFAD